MSCAPGDENRPDLAGSDEIGLDVFTSDLAYEQLCYETRHGDLIGILGLDIEGVEIACDVLCTSYFFPGGLSDVLAPLLQCCEIVKASRVIISRSRFLELVSRRHQS
jgi:hypothetical protein